MKPVMTERMRFMIKDAGAVILPLGTKTAIARALEIAIAALEGREINPIPANRPRMARKLKIAQRRLLEAKVIWP